MIGPLEEGEVGRRRSSWDGSRPSKAHDDLGMHACGHQLHVPDVAPPPVQVSDKLALA